MRTINNKVYPTGLAELDDLMHLNIVLNDYNSFQLCHSEIDVSRSFFLLMRVLDSEQDTSNPSIITLKGIEFMVITTIWAGHKLYFNAIEGKAPIYASDNTSDSDYHKYELLNLQVNLKKVKPDDEVLIDENDNDTFLAKEVFQYNEPIIFNTTTQRLHLRVDIEGEEEIRKGDTANVRNNTCQNKGIIITPIQ